MWLHDWRAETATIATLETKLRELPPDMLSEVENFIEFLVEKRRRAELEQQAAAHGWPAGFFAQTAGSINDPSFVRHPQGEPEERPSLE